MIVNDANPESPTVTLEPEDLDGPAGLRTIGAGWDPADHRLKSSVVKFLSPSDLSPDSRLKMNVVIGSDIDRLMGSLGTSTLYLPPLSIQSLTAEAGHNVFVYCTTPFTVSWAKLPNLGSDNPLYSSLNYEEWKSNVPLFFTIGSGDVDQLSGNAPIFVTKELNVRQGGSVYSVFGFEGAQLYGPERHVKRALEIMAYCSPRVQRRGLIHKLRKTPLHGFQWADWEGIVPPLGNELYPSLGLGGDIPTWRNRDIHDYARKIGEGLNKVKTGIGKVFKH
jgi:hypothetical protein